jgi:Tol biopolymer transport system component
MVSARSLASRIVLSVVVSATVLALSCGSASAELTHPFRSSFGSFINIQSIAVDQATGVVYVYDSTYGTIYKFTENGAATEFSALKSDAIEGVGGNNGEAQIAVDNSTGPAKGDIYLANGAHVAIYAPDGSTLGEISEAPGAPWSEPCGVSVDPTGAVYVGLNGGDVNKYVPKANPVTDADYSASLIGLSSPCNVAVDSVGNVFAETWPAGPITQYGALQFGALAATGSVVDNAGSTLAVDPANDELYVDEGEQISQFGPHGEPFQTPIDTFSTLPEGSLSGSAGIAVQAADGDVYAGERHGHVAIFGPLATLPDVASELPTGVTVTGATLQGTVNPDGLSVSQCEFQYGPYFVENEYEAASFHGYTHTASCSPDPGAGTSPVAVRATVSGLLANTKYNVRLIATNANGTNYSQPSEFTTLSPPLIGSVAVEHVGTTGAQLQAQVDPMGSATSYHFQYGLSEAYGEVAPAPDGTAGSGTAYVPVEQFLGGLQPDSTYHYRVVAVSANGTTAGADHTFKTFPGEVASADNCPNAQIRQAQFSSYLPDCRAYELVSPTEKQGGNVAADGNTTQSAPDGDAVKFYSTVAFGDAKGIETRGAEYISQRSPEGWTTHSINPEQNALPFSVYTTPEYQAFSEDLTKGIYYAHSPVTPGHPNVEHASNLYLRTDLLTAFPGSYELLSESASPLGHEGISQGKLIEFAGASADWSHIIFESIHNLTADAPPQSAQCLQQETAFSGTCKPRLYEWFDGAVHLVGILPNGEAAESSIAGAGAGGNEHIGRGTFTAEAISTDGSRIVFEAGPFEQRGGGWGAPEEGQGLYMRIDGRETIKLNASERTEPDPNGPQGVIFQTATADDSKVFFTTTEALTNDAQVNPVDRKLYMYDFDAPAGKHLTLIAEGESSGGLVSGISTDGSYVYFEDERALVPGQPPVPYPTRALYVWHDGAIRYVVGHRFITGQSGGDVWDSESDGRDIPPNFRVSRDGQTIVFASRDPETARLTGHESAALGEGREVQNYAEIYVYNYDSEKLVCASCNPSGALPTGNAGFTANIYVDGFDSYGPTELDYTDYKTRALSDDGRYVFFDTPDALVPQDTNGQRDVYAYEIPTGQVHLISGGTCGCASTFVDATADGSNVFFVTHQSLVRADIDSNGDLYDARVDGGIPSQNVAPPQPCEGDDCQGPAKTAPVFSLPASSTFAGVGNTPAAPSGEQLKAKSKTLTRAQKRAKALRACRRKPRRKRVSCEASAKRRYGAHQSLRRTSRRAGRSNKRGA